MPTSALPNKLLFLGTGASMGIPVIGCSCSVCTSDDPRNRRLRTSALLEWEGRRVLIDPGPDFREQALVYGINHLDGVILTHAHYDHIGGIDELRIYYFLQKQPLPCLLSKATLKQMKMSYAHLFLEPDHGKTVAAQFHFTSVGEPFLDLPIRHIHYKQAGTEVMGIRVGDFAYLTDIREYEESIFEELTGVDTLVVSALRPKPSNLHFSLDEAIAFAKKVGAMKTYFVHMAHELDHNTSLPEGMQFAYDGLEVAL